jgi:2-keto-4-pentenoate hydratase/2-oxohepta-3-ene-1,7-dioic acid hydratase in catechol pathway
MRLVSFFGPEDSGTGLLVGDRVIPLLDGTLADFDLDPEALDELGRRAAALEGPPACPVDELELIAPFPSPGKIVCVGLNYREHVTEGGGRNVPSRPLLFAKFGNAVIADGEPIIRPEGTHALDLEVELGVVIGSIAQRVDREDASTTSRATSWSTTSARATGRACPRRWPRARPGDGQWLRAKGSDTFLPMGPVFVTADEIADPQALRLRSWRTPAGSAEGVLMQDGSTADMIWGVADLVALISRSITLEPGDIIATGTPSGVGVFRDPPIFLEPGDRVRCEIDGIGAVENPVVDWADAGDDAADLGDFSLDEIIGDR